MQEVIREKYIKENIVIIVAEDYEYLKKIENDFLILPDLLIVYKDRRIVKINVLRKSILSILMRPKVVISEYFNAVPRLVGFLLKAKTISIIYGVLNFDNFKKKKISLKDY